MDARPCPSVYDDESWEIAPAFRVSLWEQPARQPGEDRPRLGWGPCPGAPPGWEQASFDLVGAQDVREAIAWAEAALAAGEGPTSRRGRPTQDREFVVYAKVGGEDRWLHVAGWNPVVGQGPPLNLHRLRP